MITIGMLKTRLNDISNLDRDISRQSERYERLRSKMTDIGSPELNDMPRNPSPDYDHLADLIYLLDGIEDYIKARTEKIRGERAWVEHVLEEIRSADEKGIIRRKYIDKEKWEDILFQMYGDEEDFIEKEESYARRLYRTHGDALEHMREVVNSKGIW